MSTRAICIENLQVFAHGAPLAALHAEIAGGTVLSVMGPSGVGKSTLLAAITGTLPPGLHMTGRVVLNGRDITDLPPQQRRIGILFQDDLLFPHLSVGGNLAFGLRPGQGDARARRALIETALGEIGLEGFAPRDPATLSGGQKARVALMRMLLSDPEALLLDEAFSGLDPDRRAQIRDLVFTRARARDLPVLMVTHDPEDARAAQGPVITLSAPA